MPARVLDRSRAALVVVDVQEALRKVVLDFEEVAANSGLLVRAARILDLPLVITEQYPKGLGSTVPEVTDHAGGAEPVAKTVFAASRDEFKQIQELVK